MDDLDQYHGTKVASGGFAKIAEENKGKPPLDPQEEYVFELIERHLKTDARGFQSAEDKAANKSAPQVAKVYLTWKEIKTGNLLIMTHRIDRLYWGNQDGSMKSGVLQFLEDIGMSYAKDQIPAWGSTFIVTMKIRARAAQKIRNGAPVPGEYIFKSGSFRKFQM